MASRSQPPCDVLSLRFIVNHNGGGNGDTKDEKGAWRLLSGIWQLWVLTRLGLGFTKGLENVGFFFCIMFCKQKQIGLFSNLNVLWKVAKATFIIRKVVKLQKPVRVFPCTFPPILSYYHWSKWRQISRRSVRNHSILWHGVLAIWKQPQKTRKEKEKKRKWWYQKEKKVVVKTNRSIRVCVWSGNVDKAVRS